MIAENIRNLQLKTIIETMTPESTAKLIPHLHSFFVTLGNVLNDLNFKVSVESYAGKRALSSLAKFIHKQ